MVIDNNSSIKNQIAAYNQAQSQRLEKVQQQQEHSANNGAITAAQPQSTTKVDKLEISETARNYTQIFDKISSGEYDKPETINVVSRKLSKLI